jgi:type VI secretion system protein ImpL
MKKMIHFLTRPWVLLFLGVFALSLLIWFLGHWLWLTAKASKIIAILSLCLIVVLYQAYQLRKKNRAAEQLLNSLTTVPIDDVTEQLHQEMENLSKNLIETLQILKKTYKGSRRSDYRYELPWYILIGASGSGKTTALENSGLNFPLDKTPAHRLESTKNCDFWLTDHAVILDMAGRYMTQDSHKTVDSGAWLHFLELLKKARPRRPINGVLITLRFSDLLLSETERKKQATAIRQRIDELHQQFGVRFPVFKLK